MEDHERARVEREAEMERTNDAQRFANLERALDEIAIRVRRVARWQANITDNPETVLDHVAKGSTLAIVMIALEQAAGRQFDAYRVLAAAVVHDFGEGGAGDVNYNLKADPRVRPVIDEYETAAFKESIKRFPEPARVTLQSAYDLQFESESFEARLFNAIERVGYALYAVRQMKVHRRSEEFVRTTMKGQHPKLLTLMDEFTSVRELYGPAAWWVEREIQQYHLRNPPLADPPK